MLMLLLVVVVTSILKNITTGKLIAFDQDDEAKIRPIVIILYLFITISDTYNTFC